MHRLAGTQALTPPRLLRSLATLLALTLGLLFWTDDADARLEGGQYFAGESAFASVAFDAFDSWFAPTAPTAAQPSYPGGSLGGLFNRPGLIGGFAAGFLGSGVIGLLFGHGVVGELSGVVSILGLFFQLALIVMLARLIWIWWRDDKADAAANLSPRQLADAYGPTRRELLPDIDQSADAAAASSAAAPDALTKSKHPRS